jgi:hypothetical protein
MAPSPPLPESIPFRYLPNRMARHILLTSLVILMLLLVPAAEARYQRRGRGKVREREEAQAPGVPPPHASDPDTRRLIRPQSRPIASAWSSFRCPSRFGGGLGAR